MKYDSSASSSKSRKFSQKSSGKPRVFPFFRCRTRNTQHARIIQNRHFKGWNLCRKFLTNWTAIKNSTHHSQIALWVAAKPWKSNQISRFWRQSNLIWRLNHSQIALWVAAKPWKTNQISRFRRASNLTWRVMGWDFFSGTFAGRGSSTCFLTFFTI